MKKMYSIFLICILQNYLLIHAIPEKTPQANTNSEIELSQKNIYSSKRNCSSNNCSTVSICANSQSLGQYLFGISDIRNKTKTICTAGCWTLSKSGSYKPFSTDISSPLIKIVSSHVEVDFGGNFIENADTSLAGWIGIEVGYSPAELEADSSLKQPKDIVLSNIHLRNFDCGILVHKGVERIVIQDSVILDASIGIVLLGDPDSYPTIPSTQINVPTVKSASIVNCKIIGHSLNRRTALVNLKTRIESTYGYTTDLFMPLRADRLNGNILDVYTYAGILATQTKNILISCVDIECTGNPDFSTEADTTRTEGIGIILRDIDLATIQNTKTHDTLGTVKAAGLQLERVYDINIYDANFSYAQSQYIATGIETFPDFLAKTIDGLSSGYDYTVEEFDLCSVKTEFQRATSLPTIGFAIGIYLTDTRGLNGENIASERNLANIVASGFTAFTSTDISFTNSSFSRNISGAATTTLRSHKKEHTSFFGNQVTRASATPNDGIIAIGFRADNCNKINCNETICNNNIGQNSGRGAQCTTCSNVIFTNSAFSYNQGSEKRTSEDTDIRTAQDTQVISKQGPTLSEAITGGYGCYVEQNSDNVIWENCKAEYNTGHRSGGFLLKDTSQFTIAECSASYQQATGTFLSSDITTFTETVAPFLTIHEALFTSNINAADISITNIIYENLLADFLSNSETIRQTQTASNTVNFTNEQALVAGISLATASIARFRLWGTACGIHIHDSHDFIIKNNNCLGQTSAKDSAIGLLLTGRNSDFEISQNNLSYNEAWSNSKQQLYNSSPDPNNQSLRYQYDLSEMKDFWVSTIGTGTAVPLVTTVSTSVLSLDYSTNKLAAGYVDTGGTDQNAQVFANATLVSEQILTNLTNDVNTVSFNSDASILAIAGENGTIILLDTITWTPLSVSPLTHGSPINRIAWNPDDSQIASAADNGTVIIWNVSTGAIDQTLTTIPGFLNALSVAWSPNGNLLATSESSGLPPANVYLYNTATWTVSYTITDNNNNAYALAFSPDNSLLASGGDDTNIYINSTATGALTATLTDHTDTINDIRWRPDGTQIAAASDDNTVVIWDWPSTTVAATLTPSAGSNVNTISWSLDGSRLATGNADGTITIYDTSTWTIATTGANGIMNFDQSGTNFTALGEQIFGNNSINTAAPYVIINSINYNLIPPAAPSAAGLYIADLATAGYITNNIINNNYAHAGHGIGIAFNTAYNMKIADNTINHNGSNIYGIGTGILDINAYSPNIYVRNNFAHNKIKSYVNASHFIPMKDASFQIDTITNDSYNRDSRDLYNLALQLPIDPDAVTAESDFDGAIQPNIIDVWNSNVWI